MYGYTKTIEKDVHVTACASNELVTVCCVTRLTPRPLPLKMGMRLVWGTAHFSTAAMDFPTATRLTTVFSFRFSLT